MVRSLVLAVQHLSRGRSGTGSESNSELLGRRLCQNSGHSFTLMDLESNYMSARRIMSTEPFSDVSWQLYIRCVYPLSTSAQYTAVVTSTYIRSGSSKRACQWNQYFDLNLIKLLYCRPHHSGAADTAEIQMPPRHH